MFERVNSKIEKKPGTAGFRGYLQANGAI